MQKIFTQARGTRRSSILALTGVLAGCSSADSDHKIRIGIKVDQPGLGYQDGNTYTGFDVEVARYVAGKLGYPKSRLSSSNPRRQPRKHAQYRPGRHDFATYSSLKAAKKTVDLRGPYYTAGQDLLVRADNTDIHGTGRPQRQEPLLRHRLHQRPEGAGQVRQEREPGQQVNSYSDCVVAPQRRRGGRRHH